MNDQIIWAPVPHCYSQPGPGWIRRPMFILDMRTGETGETEVWLRYPVDMPVLLEYFNNTDKYHKYTSIHTHA